MCERGAEYEAVARSLVGCEISVVVHNMSLSERRLWWAFERAVVAESVRRQTATLTALVQDSGPTRHGKDQLQRRHRAGGPTGQGPPT